MRSQWLQVGVKYTTLLLALCVPASAKVLFVRPAGGGDGSSWTTALPSVQGGLDAALSGDEVWVAEGTYKEQITLKSGVALYGGFVGHETERSQRNWTENPTILDGETVRTVVLAGAEVSSQANLDGFTIQRGAASNGSTDQFGYTIWYGGGIYSNGADLDISNCVIQNNAVGGFGGGVYIAGGNCQLTGNTFRGNRALLADGYHGQGGGQGTAIYAVANSSGKALQLVFSDNDVHDNGSPSLKGYVAVYLHAASAVVNTNVIHDNTGALEVSASQTEGVGNIITENGGGVSIGADGMIYVADNIVMANANYGLGAGGATGIVERNTVIGNGTPGHLTLGGLLCASSGQILTVRDNLVMGNHGPGIWVPDTPGTNHIYNNTVVGNNSPASGAGITLERSHASDVVANNIVAFNQSSDPNYGAGIYASYESPTFRNNDVYGNLPVNYARVADPTGTNGNISADPLFVDRSAGNYRLLPGSPAIDAGNDSLTQATETDLDGNARRMGLLVDMGAYESGVPNPDGLALAVRALRVAAGLDAAPVDWQTLNAQDTGASAGLVDLLDAAVLIRRSLGVH